MRLMILTGGTSKRFGSDKSQALINGRTLLEIAIDGRQDVIVVGPQTSIPATYIREKPESGGPVAAIAAGLSLVDTKLVAIVAVDMPFATRLIEKLESSLINDAALAVDADGIAQPLAGVYRSSTLREAIASFPNVANNSMKSLIEKLRVDLVPQVDTELLLDIDTKDELIRAVDLASRLAL